MIIFSCLALKFCLNNINVQNKTNTHVVKKEKINFLIEKFNSLIQEFENKDIPRPENWGGFIVNPVEYEFWQGGENRLHDRIRYKLVNNLWKIDRLSP